MSDSLLKNLARRIGALSAGIEKAQGAFASGHKFFGNQYTVVPNGTVLTGMNFGHKAQTLSDLPEHGSGRDSRSARVGTTVNLTPAQYDAFGRNLLSDQRWLGQGFGGTDQATGALTVTQVTAPGRRPLYVDDEGFNYARYVAYGPKGAPAQATGAGSVEAGHGSRAAMRPVTSNNHEWGFFGTHQSNYGSSTEQAATAFNRAARDLVSAGHFGGMNAARDYLDSRSGRHIADALSFDPAKGNASVLGVNWLARDVKSYKAEVKGGALKKDNCTESLHKAKGAYAPGHKFNGNQYADRSGLMGNKGPTPEQSKAALAAVTPVERIKLAGSIRQAALKWTRMSDSAGVDARTISQDADSFMYIADSVKSGDWKGASSSIAHLDTAPRDAVLAAIPQKLWWHMGFEPLHPGKR